MKQVTCRPASFAGDVTVPPSKSFAHRAILCAALADGESVLSPVAWNRDIEATLNAARALGAEAAFDAESQFREQPGGARLHGLAGIVAPEPLS